MRRLLGGSFVVVATLALLGLFTASARATPPDCDEPGALCTEPVDSIVYEGAYTGHDEPSLLFYSNSAGAGNSSLYRLRVPSDPNVQPNQAGTAGTWNFQLHPAFWFGMALCDNQSAPEFTHAPCVADSEPSGPRLHREAPRHGLSRGAVLSAGMGAVPAAGRHQLRHNQVVRRDGDLQLQPGPEHDPGHEQQLRLPEHGRCRACELRLHHEERRSARSTRAARPDSRDVHAQPGDRPVHELR